MSYPLNNAYLLFIPLNEYCIVLYYILEYKKRANLLCQMVKYL